MVRALVFLGLIASSRAYRVSEDSAEQHSDVLAVEVGTEGEAFIPEGDYEQQWKLENAACTWSQEGCGGEGCESRHLPLDRSHSQSCRLSDAHMLSVDPRRYYFIQTELLAAKARKFAEGCPSVHFWHLISLRRCERRALHMMRAMEFISKVQAEGSLMSDLSADERDNQAMAYDEAMGHISNVLGADADLVMELRRKVSESPGALRGDPEGTLNDIVEIMVMLVRGTEAQKEEARQRIMDLQLGNGDATTAEDVAEEEDRLQNIAAHLESQASEARRQLEEASLDAQAEEAMGEEEGSTSLVEVESGEKLAGWLEGRESTVVVAVVVVLLVTLLFGSIGTILMGVFWLAFITLFVAMVGCGVASFIPGRSGIHCGHAGGAKDILRCELTCVRRSLSMAFSYAKEGARTVGEMASSAVAAESAPAPAVAGA